MFEKLFKKIQPLQPVKPIPKQTQTVEVPIRTQSKPTAWLEQLLVSQIHQGIICVDQNLKVLFLNPYANKYIDVVDPVGKLFSEVLKCKTTIAAAIEGFFVSAFAGSLQNLPQDLSLVCNRGTFPVSGTLLPLKKDNEVVVVAFIFQDNASQNLELTDRKNFLSATAHELRTPLTVIRANITVIRDFFDKLGKDKIIELITSTEQVVIDQLTLVNDLLQLAHLEKGNLEVKKESFDIQKLVDEVIREQLPFAKDKKLYLNHTIEDLATRLVKGDRMKAKEVLTNLVSNAIKYTYQGGVTVTHAAIEEGIATKVVDTGVGIEPQYALLMFQNFQQIGYTRSLSTAKSTGLGLYISKKLANLMQGDVILEQSEPGQGSTFTFTLPRAD